MSNHYRLAVPGYLHVEVASTDDLRRRLAEIPTLLGQVMISLELDEKNDIRAKASGDLWQVSTRRGGWWTKQSFSSALSTAWSDGMAKAGGSFLRWFDEREHTRFTTAQMAELFTAHFEGGKKYPYPYVGA